MKTNISLRQNSAHFYLIGLLSFLAASCGSYQNTSYHDNDGVYGSSTQRTYAQTSNTNANNQYKDYFKSLQDTNDQPNEIFTDVDNYGNYADSDSTQTATAGYPAWGSTNTDAAVVNVYPSSSWSWGISMGWGYPYYGYGYPYYGYGYGYPGYGWGGYPGYGWGYPGYYPYHYYGNYNYSYGRRGSAAYYGSRNYVSRGYASRGNFTSRPGYSTNRGNGYSDFRRSSSINGRTSTSPTFTNRSSQNYNYGNRGQSNSNYNYSNRSSNNSGRSYSPSSSGSMNSGGGMRSSGGGGGGGGRSYGGGGGGGRR